VLLAGGYYVQQAPPLTIVVQRKSHRNIAVAIQVLRCVIVQLLGAFESHGDPLGCAARIWRTAHDLAQNPARRSLTRHLNRPQHLEIDELGERLYLSGLLPLRYFLGGDCCLGVHAPLFVDTGLGFQSQGAIVHVFIDTLERLERRATSAARRRRCLNNFRSLERREDSGIVVSVKKARSRRAYSAPSLPSRAPGRLQL